MQRQQREGSALTGLWVVFRKELEDFTGSIKLMVLAVLILLTAAASVSIAAVTLKNYVEEDQFLLLSLFTLSGNSVPSFLSFMSFLVPLTAIVLGFDAINSEFQNRTLGRILSQPIYRDVLLFGKALGALAAMALILLVLWLLVLGCGMWFLGVAPTGEQIGRAFVFYLVTLLYGALWFTIAMVCSIITNNAAASALISIAIWLFTMIFWPIIAQVLASAIGGNDAYLGATMQVNLARISPFVLYSQASVAILNPTTRSLGVVLFYQMDGALGGSPLPFWQSFLLVLPHMAAFVASVIVWFIIGYRLFLRREIRM